ncbi:hypothetical protein AMJ83_11260 [candidate division WOR_3 bacterium SM23_42]|uniref:Uncharacterized protein n=1 Tax=candidate division WOR_3 bacterium SM23_42 TaxID=1703779 RepID=A0A0S8FQU3_UNCW3|nr:MAG: hypothetical protein AMJ83_11260 [candidate division WOR_3 bacterium SM23_42]
MKIYERLMTIDRRIIYAILLVVVTLPLVFPSVLKVTPMTPVEKLFTAVDNTPDDKALILDCSYAPQIKAEVEPMAIAVLRHAFKTRKKILVLSLYVEMIGLATRAINQVVEEFNSVAETYEDSLIYGRDYVFLGWQPPPIVPMLGMGESISNIYVVDYYGNQTDTLQIMQKVKNYNDISILVALSGSTIPISWVAYAQNRYGLRVGVGCTAVSGADFYTYYQTGQFTGLMVGMKGAAEYEELVEANHGVKGRRVASEAMLSLTYAHLIIMLFIVIGNIGFFLHRRRK